MRIYTKSGNLPFKTFLFPDGQPHFELLLSDGEFRLATIETRIKDSEELMTTLLALDVLTYNGYDVNLDIRYLMGARMDKRNNERSPLTLDVVHRTINSQHPETVRVLDAHNPKALPGWENVLPFEPVKTVLKNLGDVMVVIPDNGAMPRVRALTAGLGYDWVRCEKKRDLQTGKILKIELLNPELVKDQDCLIIDDICDGGATFTGIASTLKGAGAKSIYLFTTHGIFSKPLPLAGIDHIYTTDSYWNWAVVPHIPVTCLPVSMKDM